RAFHAVFASGGRAKAVRFALVEVALEELALDRQRLNHLLRHQRYNALVVAAVQDQQRRCDLLRRVERRAASVRLSLFIRRAHLAVQIEPADAVAVPVAFSDLGVAGQIDAAAEGLRRGRQRTEHEVAAVAAPVDADTSTIDPRLTA